MSTDSSIRSWISHVINQDYSFAGGAFKEIFKGLVKLKNENVRIDPQDWDDIFLALKYLMRQANKLGQDNQFVTMKLSESLEELINGSGRPLEESWVIERFPEVFPDLSGPLGGILARNQNTPHQLLLAIHQSCKCAKTPAENNSNCRLVARNSNFLSNPLTPTSVLTEYASSRDVELRAAVAANPNSPDSLLLEMWLSFENNCTKVHSALASNVSTPGFVLNIIRRFIKDPTVQNSLDNNPKFRRGITTNSMNG